MIWLASAILAVFLLWRFTKVTIILSAIIAIGSAVIFGGIVGHETYQNTQRSKQRDQISVAVKFGSNSCGTDRPLLVMLRNKNDFSVDSVSVRVVAREEGRSSELYHDYLTSDFIMPAGKGSAGCWALSPDQVQSGSISGKWPGNLSWYGSVSYFTKSQ